jgi:hypothetical protein
MEAVRSLEKTLDGLYKNTPHLPAGGRQWLGDNIWWIALIGAVLSVVGLLTVVPFILAVMGIGASLGEPIYNMYAPGASFGLYWLTALIAVVNIAASALLLSMAVNPLKAKAKKGWTLVFLSLLISFILTVISDIIIIDIVSIFFTTLWAAIGGYFLFEIHDQFGKVTAKKSIKK